MRILLLSFGIIFLALASIAQPIIDGSSAPQGGTSWTEISTDIPNNIDLGPSGANQTWDFSGATGDFESDVLNFILPSQLPAFFDGMFPESDVALYTAGDSTAQFFVQTTDGLYTDGLGASSDILPPPYDQFDFEPNDLLFPFDFGYTDVRNDEAGLILTFDGGVPIQERSRIFSEHTADGYGTVITPAGSFSNVLRVKIARYNVDSTFADTDMDGEFEFISANEPTEPMYTYFYLQNQSPMLVALLEMNEDQSAIEWFSYFQNGATGITEHGLNSGIRVYPNPSQGSFFLGSNETGSINVRVFDLNGKLMYQEIQWAAESAQPIELQHLNSGTYVIEIESKGRKSSTQISIE